jgi:hypothetical protein
VLVSVRATFWPMMLSTPLTSAKRLFISEPALLRPYCGARVHSQRWVRRFQQI